MTIIKNPRKRNISQNIRNKIACIIRNFTKSFWNAKKKPIFQKIISEELSRQQKAERQQSKLAEPKFSIYKKKFSARIKLQGFVVSSLGVTWKKTELPKKVGLRELSRQK